MPRAEHNSNLKLVQAEIEAKIQQDTRGIQIARQNVEALQREMAQLQTDVIMKA